MQVNFWGPPGWTFLHTITFNYKPSEENKIKYLNFFNSLETVLPCPYCCSSFGTYAKSIPISEYIDTREGLVYWLYIIHNLVNQKVCKQLPSFKSIVMNYEKYRAKCGKITAANQVEVKTCQAKQKENINEKEIDDIVKRTYKMYREKTNKYILELFTKNNENPNKESLDVHLDCKNINNIDNTDNTDNTDIQTTEQSTDKKTLSDVLSDYDNKKI
jgi:hypothetical protein